ncbi:MAG: glycosyltransferase family 2 protein [Flavobacteriaceae bacterium]|nr:glycosyltransferase family 2 protein [Flavobacteriaceae bacterium]
MFSIIIPVFNKVDLIYDCVYSVLNQVVQEFEVLIIDDGSTDNSIGIVKEFSDPRIKIFQKTNGGVSSARNLGMQLANFDWLVFLDSDDVMDSKYLLFLREAIAMFDSKIFSVNYQLYNVKKRDYKFPKLTTKVTNGEKGYLINYFKSVFWGNPILTGSTTCIHKDLIHDGLKFEDGIRRGEDLDFWFRICLKSDVVFINEFLITYKVGLDASSMTSKFQPKDIYPYYRWFKLCSPRNVYMYLYTIKRCFWAMLNIFRVHGLKGLFIYVN